MTEKKAKKTATKVKTASAVDLYEMKEEIDRWLHHKYPAVFEDGLESYVNLLIDEKMKDPDFYSDLARKLFKNYVFLSLLDKRISEIIEQNKPKWWQFWK